MINIILIEPQNSGNIGAIARCMKNFGFENLMLVNPKCNHLDATSIARASHAIDILKNAQIIKKAKIKNFDCVIGTTSVVGNDYNISRIPLTPTKLAKLIANVKGNIAIIFGRESKGLNNKEISLCDFIVTISATKKYPSLNLSHSVAIILYELFKKSPKGILGKKFRYATKKEKQIIMRYLNNVLERMDFHTKEKKDTQRKVWKRMIGKSFLTKREAFALIGFLRKI